MSPEAKSERTSGGRRHLLRDAVRAFGAPALLSLVALGVALWFVQPAPPRHLTIATGSEDGAYIYYGRWISAALAEEGIDAAIRSTSGSVENIGLLESGAVDVAFVQGGTGGGANAPTLRSLASLYFEPLWVFVRAEGGIKRLADLRGKRVAIDREGSGTRAVAFQLLGDLQIGPDDATLLPQGEHEAAEALKAGAIDAAFFIVAPRSTVVQGLIRAPEARLLSIDRAHAFALQHHFLSPLVLPEGAIDLAADLPPGDVTLLAPAATLVVREDFHPALSELLLRVSREIFGEPGLFEEASQFPSPKYLEFPISPAATRFFTSGPSFLQRYLPFWAANLVDRLKILLLPLITLVYPFFKLLPSLYDWRIRSRINRWYRELGAVEKSLEAATGPDERRRSLAELDRLEAIVGRIPVPLSYANALYTLRSHIDLLRNELRQSLGG